MPLKYKRRTPIQDRIYRSSPAIVQSKLPGLRKVVRSAASTPSSVDRQSTLTQINFAAPRQFAMNAEIADSDDDFDFVEERPVKRVKMEDHVSSKRSLLKQSTLTQMDYVAHLQDGIPDSQEDSDEEIDTGNDGSAFGGCVKATKLDGNLGSSEARIQQNNAFKTFRERHIEQVEEQTLKDLFTIKSFSETDKISDSPEPRHTRNEEPPEAEHQPETPKHNRTLPVPSSHTPAATPISILGEQIREANPEPVSPTPVRMAPPPLPLVRRSLPKDEPLSETPILTVTQQTQSQSQTQTTPMTKAKVYEFNRIYSELIGNPFDIPGMRQSKMETKSTKQQDSFDMGEETPEMFLQMDMFEANLKSAQSSNPNCFEAQAPFHSEREQHIFGDGDRVSGNAQQMNQVIVIPSSQDDEIALDLSQTSDGLSSPQPVIIPASSPKINTQHNNLPISANHVASDTQFDVQFSQTSLRPSQASTAPCTPKADENARPVLDSPSRDLVEDASQSLPAFQDYNPQESDTTATPKRITVSQLLPSSLIGSDIPRPPQDSQTWKEEEEEEDDDEL